MAADKGFQNSYTVCRVLDKKNREAEEFVKTFATISKEPNDVLYMKSCRRDLEKNHDQSYIMIVKKYINDDYKDNVKFQEESGIIIKRFFPGNEPIGQGKTFGLHIKTEEINPQNVVNVFTNMETHGFLKKGSYEIVFPRPYPDGSPRKYLIVTFKKYNDYLPKKFIRKLKTVLHNSVIEGKQIKVNWLSNSVKKDILHGENKAIKKKED